MPPLPREIEQNNIAGDIRLILIWSGECLVNKRTRTGEQTRGPGGGGGRVPVGALPHTAALR